MLTRRKRSSVFSSTTGACRGHVASQATASSGRRSGNASAVLQNGKPSLGRCIQRLLQVEASKAFRLLPVWLLDAVLPVMLPTSSVKVGWSLWTLLLALYLAIDVPLLIAFDAWRAERVVHALGWLATATFSFDIVLHFRTAYMTEQGELIRTPHLIATHYLHSMFVFDLLSTVPMDEIVNATTTGSVHEHAYWLGLLRLPRLFVLVRQVNALIPVRYMNLVAVARLLCAMLLITHFAACLWCYLSHEIPGMPWVFTMDCPSWPDRDKYLYAFYRSFLLMLGDRPIAYNNIERGMAVALLSLGACMYAIVMSNMTLLVSNMWSMASRHKQRSTMVQDTLRYGGAGDCLRVKVDAYFDVMAQFEHPGPDGVSFLSELPAPLHAEVLASVFEPMLVQVQLFANCERPFVWRLAQKLRLSLYMPRDMIYDLDSVGHDMYIIWRGGVALVEVDGCMVALLSDGDHFGELGLMAATTPRPHRAVALRPTDVMVLGRWDLQDVMKDFPDSAALVKWRARVPLEDHEIGPAVWMAAFTAPAETEEEAGHNSSNDMRRGEGGLDARAPEPKISSRVPEDSCPDPGGPNKALGADTGDPAPGGWTGETCTGALRRRLCGVVPRSKPAAASAAAAGPVAEATEDGCVAISKCSWSTADAGLQQTDEVSACLSEDSVFKALYQGKSHGSAAGRVGSIGSVSSAASATVRAREPRGFSSQHPGMCLPVQPTAQLEPHNRTLRRGHNGSDRTYEPGSAEHTRLVAVRSAGESGTPQSRLMRSMQDAITASGSRRPAVMGDWSALTGAADEARSRNPGSGTGPQPGGHHADADPRRSQADPTSTPQMFILPPQPFLGLDPLGPLLDEPARGNDNSTGARRRNNNRAGLQAGAATCRDATFLTGDEVFQINEHLVGLAAACRSLRPGPRSSARRASGTGAARRSSEGSWGERFFNSCQGCSDPRCALREQQLAQANRKLAEAQAQVAAILETPLKVPGIMAAFQVEVAATAARLSAQTDAALQRVADLLQGVEVRTEGLSQQLVAADLRLQHLEGEGTAFAEDMPVEFILGGSGRALWREKHENEGAGASVQGTSATTSPVRAGPEGLVDGDTGRRLTGSLGQSSLRRQHRRLSALEVLKALPESDPLAEVATGAGGSTAAKAPGGSDAVLTRSMSIPDASATGLTTKDRAGKRVVKRRSSAFDLLTLSAHAGAAAGADQLQQQQQRQQGLGSSRRLQSANEDEDPGQTSEGSLIARSRSSLLLGLSAAGGDRVAQRLSCKANKLMPRPKSTSHAAAKASAVAPVAAVTNPNANMGKGIATPTEASVIDRSSGWPTISEITPVLSYSVESYDGTAPGGDNLLDGHSASLLPTRPSTFARECNNSECVRSEPATL